MRRGAGCAGARRGSPDRYRRGCRGDDPGRGGVVLRRTCASLLVLVSGFGGAVSRCITIYRDSATVSSGNLAVHALPFVRWACEFGTAGHSRVDRGSLGHRELTRSTDNAANEARGVLRSAAELETPTASGR